MHNSPLYSRSVKLPNYCGTRAARALAAVPAGAYVAEMNKAKSKPKVAAAEPPARPATAGSRARDLEEDIFDVAHNTMLRSKVSAATSIATAALAATALTAASLQIPYQPYP